MADISSVVISTMTGMIGVVIGAIISNYFNQKIARQAAKKDVIFKKKIEYFENIVNCIEKNIEMYTKSMKKVERLNNKREVDAEIKRLKKERRKFEIMTSPLYLDIGLISRGIKQFVDGEKKIFSYFEDMRTENKAKDEIVDALKLKIIELKRIGALIITLLRKELMKDN